MKNNYKKILSFRELTLMLVFVMFVLIVPAIAQDEIQSAKPDKPARPAFESAWWFDGQTGVLYDKNTFEYVIQHRFGLVNSGNRDLFGIYGPSNIRLGFAYAPIQKLNIGFGYTKNKMILDLNAKYGILTQTRKNAMPISLTYYVNMGVELLERDNYVSSLGRYNYFHQLFIMKRFNSKFSTQLAPSFSHYNAINWERQIDDTWEIMENDTWGMSVGIRYKLKPQLILMLGYDQPITQHSINQPNPSINFGLEIATSSHAFQIFASNNNRIQTQENFMYNQNDFTEGQWLIGFNITRLWSF